ncbi:transporter substrate-binding domain-containing protein [Pikeienuella piscinae]|uniref:Transporter substrate-binding domain-containing protein n=1 Tax=Pikeienuella piscinae TaxID=2748098 RepID=A0A7L5BT67_9RHOB|nr:transporter substrate-binding domain-containing protein [Pikeienuella piscinae]QIE55070.1 transporter substrate-binding domain-containing protein [Pikeienuella piscinae]
MKILGKLTGGAIAAAALLAVGASAASAQQTTMDKIATEGKITVAVQTQGPPVSFVDSKGERTGLVIDIMKMMAEDMGVELVIQDYDWKGLIPALKSGKVDLIAADMTPTAKRSMQVVFTDPVFFAENVAFALKSKGFTKWQDLNADGMTVAATQASTYADAARKHISKAELKEYAGGTAQTTQAVAAGRADGGVTDKASLAQYTAGDSEFMMLDGVLAQEPLGFAVRPDSLHLLFTLNNYIGLIRYDGRLQERLAYWWESLDWEKDHK